MRYASKDAASRAAAVEADLIRREPWVVLEAVAAALERAADANEVRGLAERLRVVAVVLRPASPTPEEALRVERCPACCRPLQEGHTCE